MTSRSSLLNSQFLIAAVAIGLLSLVVNVPAVRGQDNITGAFVGKVVDSQTSAPIAGATVKIVNMDTGRPLAVKTDAEGTFRKALLSPGDYQITISKDGYLPFEKLQSLGPMRATFIVPTPIALSRVPTPLPTPDAVTRDTTPPTIQISSPQVNRGIGLGVTTGKLTVTGRVSDASGVNEVLVQGTPAELDEAGNFSALVLLKVGENKITVTAIDTRGNQATEDFTLRRTMIANTPAAPSVPTADMGRYYALVIGNNDYQELTHLKTAENDAKEIEAILREKYGFETKLLPNAKRKDIIQALVEYRRKLEPTASLLVYYAGHGYRDPETEIAYWLPVDANKDNSSEWISADDVTGLIRAIPARHILIVSDSCYSGTLARDAGIGLSSPSIQKLSARKSRNLMASGGNEPVPDGGGAGNHSVFASALLRGLKEIEKDVFSAADLFHDYVRDQVAGSSHQLPDYRFVPYSGDDGGDFIFVRKN